MVAYEEIFLKFQQVSRRLFYTGNELSELGLYLFYDGIKNFKSGDKILE